MDSQIDRTITYQSTTTIDRDQLIQSPYRRRKSYRITQHCIILSLLIKQSPINRTTGIDQSITGCTILTQIP